MTADTETDTSPDSDATRVEATPAGTKTGKHTRSQSDDGGLTTNRKLRWDLLASVVAGAACVSLLVIVLMAVLGIATLSGVPQGFFLLYSTLVLTSTVWTFGGEALAKAREAMQGE